MYQFRYHVLTITGIFLALGIGLFLGIVLAPEWMLKQQVNVLEHLEQRYHALQLQHNQLRGQMDQLQKNAVYTNQELQVVGTHYIANRLTGKHVAILNVSQMDTTAMTDRLKEAGAEVCQNIQLDQLGAVLHNALDENQLGRLGWQGQGTQAVMMVNALVTDVVSGEDTQLQKLSSMGLVDVVQNAKEKPDYVIVAGGTYGSDRNFNTLRLQEFDRVLVGALKLHQLPVVTVERTDSTEVYADKMRGLGISSIDNIDHVAGQIALIDVLNGARGHFGSKTEAEALLPELKISKEVFGQ